MITEYSITCKQCKETRYHRVLFIGTEFACQCPVCEALYIYYESVFYDVREHWTKPNWSKYVGYWYRAAFYDVQKPEIAKRFQFLLEHRTSEKEVLEIVKLTSRTAEGSFFVASMIHDHFQEAFRAVYQMKGRLSKFNAYNVLLMPDTRFEFLLEEKEKLKGIDQVWKISFTKEIRWPFVNTEEDAKKSWKICNAVQEQLDLLEGLGVFISKRAGAVENGKQLLKSLLEPLSPLPLYDNKRQLLDKKYIGILTHPDNTKRAGLCEIDQLRALTAMITKEGYSPLVIATTKFEYKIGEQLDCPVVSVFSLSEQAQLYRDCISFVIGTNCSGCNIPALYDVPMFIYVKERGYPDDFYCFARMASQYNKKSDPWQAELEKADNIIEYKVPCEKGLNLTSSYPVLVEQLRKKCSNQKRDQGIRLLFKGYRDTCPKCSCENSPLRKVLRRTDIYVEYSCKCGCQYVSQYGLTTSSFVGKKEGALEQIKYNENPLKIEHFVLNKKRNPIYFLAIKPSIADLHYVLPSLLLLRKDFPDRSLRVITHAEYRGLIPESLLDELYLIGLDSPYELLKKDCLEEKYLTELIKDSPLINNYPGILPHSRNLYYEVGKYFQGSLQKTFDVVICCRFGNRSWPSFEVIDAFVSLLKKRGLKYSIFVFPRNESSVLDNRWLKLPNLMINPDIQTQIVVAKSTRVWVSPHGASEVIPSITRTAIIELETDPPWWKNVEPQPIRFGLPDRFFKQIKRTSLNEIRSEEILTALEELL